MKVRDSGMPEAELWDSFFDPARTLDQLGFEVSDNDVVEFGCGYGTFTLEAARRTSGTVFALDIEPAMVETTAARAEAAGVLNISTRSRDFVQDGTGLSDESAGYALLFNILHAEDPLALLGEAKRVLMPGGIVAVTHWIHDAHTPRGPDLGIRPRPEQCAAWLEQAGFEVVKSNVALPPYHYGLTGRR